MENNNELPRPWYKEFWPWLVFSIPFLTVVAGVATYFIAADQPHSMVKDNYFKEGLAINRAIKKVNAAKELNLVAEIKLDRSNGLISAKLNQDIQSNQITILLSHPTRSERDHQIPLDGISQSEYIGQLPELSKAYWYIQISPNSEQWILKSRFHYPESENLTINASDMK
ncbi:FixH family protein [Aliikangiella sp. G2MR2-5]|uniref:FixH family protein n=1 Tax=Aliikangiella sp. G2MR2-5 TaxID=2788943 RepID=UPI0018AC3241|nr:FixH family protein [Aliikangiella sp. G2MR2-5]